MIETITIIARFLKVIGVRRRWHFKVFEASSPRERCSRHTNNYDGDEIYDHVSCSHINLYSGTRSVGVTAMPENPWVFDSLRNILTVWSRRTCGTHIYAIWIQIYVMLFTIALYTSNTEQNNTGMELCARFECFPRKWSRELWSRRLTAITRQDWNSR